MHKPKQKLDKEKSTTIVEAAVPLGTKKNLENILKDYDIGGVPQDIKNRLISIIHRTMKAFSLTPEGIGCLNGFEIPLK